MTRYVTGGPPRFAHQRRGLAKLIDTGGVAALLFDPGLGKTAVVLDYAGLLALKSPRCEARVLVVCPLVAVDTWVLQSHKFMSPMVDWWAEALGGSLLQRAEALAARGGSPFTRGLAPRRKRARPAHPRALHHDLALAWGTSTPPERSVPPSSSEGPDGLGAQRPRVVLEVANIDTFSSRLPVGSKTMADVVLDAVRRFDPDLVVVDESHKIKSASGRASKLLDRIGQHVRRRVILTGTVMPHSPLDVFGQWRFLEPYAFGETLSDGSRRRGTVASFKARYVDLGGWMGREVVGFHNLDHMQQTMARNAVVARKAEALDLPPTTDIVLPVDLSPAERTAYADMKRDLAVQLQTGALATVPNRLAQMMRLRQITAGHLPDDSGRITQLGTSKVALIASLVNDTLLGERRVVVFALFQVEIGMLETALREPDTEVMVITGATPIEQRAAMRARFGSDEATRMVLIAQVKTMSLAVNELVTASHAVFASLSQQRDDYEQAKARLDRQGQTKPVTFWHAVAAGTVDSVILQSHRDRSDLETAMLRHIQGDNSA